jgi:hypothetical protein
MKENVEFRWLTSEDAKEPLKILGLNKTEKDKILLLQNQKNEFVKCSIWGRNWNFLVFHESDSDLWTGKTIHMNTEIVQGKNIRTIVKVV